MDYNELSKFIVICATSVGVLAPVLAISVRIAIRPVVDAIARLRESGQASEVQRMLERRMDLLEQEVQGLAGLRDDIARLADAHEFHLRLTSPREPVRDET